MSTYRKILREGLWDNNMIASQLLAMCPAMAVTATATNGLGMGLATTAVLVASNTLVSSIRHLVPSAVRIPIFIVLIASLVTLVDLALNAWLHELYKVLGLFIALIVVNCGILGRAESFASRSSVPRAALDGLAMGLGFTLAMVAIGAVREVIGSGSLFAQAQLLLGPAFGFLELRLFDGGALLMVLPPGGFLVLGGLLAAKRALEGARRRRGVVVAQSA
ncbi:MAG: electron transport complex subunit E [Zoogloeaceae bacterium]|nr:electron transport complex subunit E [Rhodocyclaceae bacterium]MCP5235865.1 electron transport complex subunit E [Zoogloeaceae bacterium]